MSGAFSAAITGCCRRQQQRLLLLRRLPPVSATAAPARTLLMMGPHDPRIPDEQEPGVLVQIKQEVPGEAKLSFKQRMAEWRARNQPEPPACDIGLPRSLLEAVRIELPNKKRQHELERLARNHQLRVNLDTIEQAWESESRPEHVLTAAKHYGLMEHLFGPGCFFRPVVPLRTLFNDPDLPGKVRSAVMGNILTPRQCSEAPSLRWLEPQDQPQKWTVLLTCPDEHLQSEREYAHWLVTDIPGSGRLAEGRTRLPYMQPIPPLGTGLHRYALILFLQSGPLDMPDGQPASDSLRLAERDFSTADFYRRHEDQLTPAGLCFFQAAWDESVRHVYRHRLVDVGAEPAFEFRWPAPYRPKMQQFAFSEPFDIYLDKYRDVKDMAEETLKEKLRSVHPFRGRLKPASKYPLAAPVEGYRPAWLKEREAQKILRRGQWSGLD